MKTDLNQDAITKQAANFVARLYSGWLSAEEENEKPHLLVYRYCSEFRVRGVSHLVRCPAPICVNTTSSP